MPKKKSKAKSLKSLEIKKKSAVEAANGDIVVVASSPSPMSMSSAKVCRLCETKEGPFLIIFGEEKNTAEKIEQLMPFTVAENDELPHKICFRCSAKVEELHEFVQKCIKTQENLYNSLGKKKPPFKVKTYRSLWEEKLHRSNVTNDDICDAVIKKAMEGIRDIPLTDDTKSTELHEIIDKSVAKIRKRLVCAKFINQSEHNVEKVETEISKITTQVNGKNSNTNIVNENLPQNELQLRLDKRDDRPSPKTRSSRSSNNVPLSEGIPTKKPNEKQTVKPKIAAKPSKVAMSKSEEPSSSKNIDESLSTGTDNKNSNQSVLNTNDISVAQPNSIEKKVEDKQFNIMNHVSLIKVNGVGVLFQCKLCNRNFLKKDVVLSHWCAKNGVAKEGFIKRAAPPEPPRIPTVKYINTKTDNTTKQQGSDNKSIQPENKKDCKGNEIEEVTKNVSTSKPKPKIGPASKIKRTSDNNATSACEPVTPTPGKSDSVLQCPVVPSLNCRYKLVPGPNNTFTLVEANPTDQNEETINKEYEAKKNKLSSKDIESECSSKHRKVLRSENAFREKSSNGNKASSEVIEITDSVQKESGHQPYPVGLFKTVSRHSNNEVPPAAVIPFATSTQKKQSYTVVQTGNPSKLLISAKPQPQTEEPPKKKHKKVKPTVQNVTPGKEPFSVTLEDTTHPKDAGFFTFINVDPLLQPSYVLPTDNSIIQESQISTSSTQPQKSQNLDKCEKYTCNMCNAVFTREQKLLVHIHSHYNKLDEEEQKHSEKSSRKRGKKS